MNADSTDQARHPGRPGHPQGPGQTGPDSARPDTAHPETPLPYVLPLDHPSAGIAEVGGKGASLARLARAGLPVPPGFQVTTAAYRAFVGRDSRQDRILAAVSGLRADEPTRCEEAARKIGRLFAEGAVPAEVSAPVEQAYASLDDGNLPVAVRSSATAEDLPGMSFAGQQDTYLNLRGRDAVLDAVRRCWASLWTARAIAYRIRHGIPASDVALAVVVQELVTADSAGVMFTVDPMTGDRAYVHVDATWGLGEALVGGQVTPDSLLVDRETFAVAHRETGDKSVRTVRTEQGTHEEPVPPHLRNAPVLDDRQAGELARIGVDVEELYGCPMDVEWARHDGQFFLVQARPVTGLPTGLPATGTEEWNDSLRGDYLWTSGNLGEAIPDVMTPCTWSLINIFMADTMALSAVGEHRLSGNIGGRFYLNLSVAAAAAQAFGMSKLFYSSIPEIFGRIPDGVTIPALPLSRWRLVASVLGEVVPFYRRLRTYQKNFPALVADAPARFERVRAAIAAADTTSALARVWAGEGEPYLRDTSRMLAAGSRMDGNALATIGRRVRKVAGEGDANALLTGLHTADGELASLGPLVGLARVRRGQLDRDTYVHQWGHRGPHEFEVSVPRPAEDPGWVDRELAAMDGAHEDATDLLARQQQAREAAWERTRARLRPRELSALRRHVDRAAHAARAREAARSEVIRAFWAMRILVRRAGELTGHGDDLFFCAIEEIVRILDGDDAPLARVPARRAAYDRYRALPVYPTLIRGAFDPVRWAADPNRRLDVYDATAEHAPVAETVTGFAGAAGVVEGVARVIASPEDGAQLRPGEILVTSVTNIGWTPLFPRAAAVVTDIGAPLSHAAIVARELGIPAVVGTGNATVRLRSGDRIRVDGERGTVDLLEALPR
ncbi:pyruvate, water dikinase [Actinopolymorpha cephalotaxi]|uniref:Pyruvate, water dikinase n=1 Tax=Actinopolymorpha cephalotaxi TaxID=504797 RepID=A0A1I2VNZ8_9ACTN|nr:PEP/pyruvate-binding domain-containing protein [Actinopolymorpha cephalotaxi]NYH83229.1 pyruvate,water dikinase [Actinopolymorpha cephalotaxi]SFG91045.1 pyruvate, water dikinase [Actinopolymorpha cephalotaxi]